MEPTNRTFDEINKSARESFFKANGYYPTVEDAIRLTEEARAEIQEEIREKRMLVERTWIELERDSETSVLCPKCNTHPKLIVNGNRSKIKCECGYIYDAETYL